jgi:hypothetical protein
MIRSLAALALAAAAPAMAQPGITPGMLGIDDGAPVRVASAAAVRRALRRCARPGGCASIMLETCDRCIISAQAEGSGFAINSRLGPPGPFYALFDNRPGRRRTRIFAPADLIEIFTGYLSGRQPGYVGTIETDDE